MIIPYFNSLIFECKNGKIDLNVDEQHKITEYFEEFFSHSQLSKDVTINISVLDQKNQAVIVCSMTTIIRQPLFEINNSYTFDKEKYCLYKGLQSLTFSEAENSKVPANINNLAKLKEYYVSYKSQKQMRDFMKSLLISSINHQKRLIKYSTIQQIEKSINKMKQNIQGNITIVSNLKYTINPLSIWIIGIDNHKNHFSLEQLIKNIEIRFNIDKSFNKNMTNKYTIKCLQKRAKELFYNLSFNAFRNYIQLESKQIIIFSKNLTFIAIMRSIFRYGLKLAQQERILKEQFIAFVQEMNTKYSFEIMKYIISFQQKLNYSKKYQFYKAKQAHVVTVSRYVKGFITERLYRAHYISWLEKKCVKIQRIIRAILIKKKMYEQTMAAYLLQKLAVRAEYKSNYSQIKDIFNAYELKKLSKFNKHKYGFSCCLYILDIDSRTNYVQFQPTALCNLIQKANKSKDLFTKVYCEQNHIQIHNIEGKVFRLGQMSSVSSVRMSTDKQNQDPNQGKYMKQMKVFRNSMRDSGFDDKNKLCRSTQFSSHASLSSSSFTFVQKDMILNRKKHKIQKGEDFQFKIDQYSRMYGRGNNYHGQLGIGNNPFSEQFINILPTERIKLVSTANFHSVAVTNSNKIYHFGQSKDRLEQSFIPIEVHLKQKLIIRDILCSYNDTYILTDHNKVYSVVGDRFIRIPKQIELQFDEFRIIKSGGLNMQIVYLVGYWTNSLDKTKKLQIVRYLTKNIVESNDNNCQSMLIQNDQLQIARGGIHELSAILEESYC